MYFIKGNGLGLLNIPQWCTTHDFDLTKKVAGLLFSNADPVSHDNRWEVLNIGLPLQKLT